MRDTRPELCSTPGCENAARQSGLCSSCSYRAHIKRERFEREQDRLTTEISTVLLPYVADENWRQMISDFIAAQTLADREGRQAGEDHAINTLLDAARKDPDLPLHHKIWCDGGGQG